MVRCQSRGSVSRVGNRHRDSIRAVQMVRGTQVAAERLVAQLPVASEYQRDRVQRERPRASR